MQSNACFARMQHLGIQQYEGYADITRQTGYTQDVAAAFG